MSKGHLHITSFVDLKLWDSAQWVGVAFLLTATGEEIPAMGLVFKNAQPALEIFTDWMARLGREDEYEQLRISIIEGDIAGQEPGYSVVISSDIQGILASAQAQDMDFEPERFVVLGRCNRMAAGTGLHDLQTFKSHYQRHKRFILVPVIYSPQGAESHDDRGIEKSRIYFRQSSDVSRTDPDAFIYLLD